MFKSIPDYRKIVLLIYIFQNAKNLLREIGLSECDINRLSLECKNILIEQHEEYLAYITNDEKSVIEKILNR